MVGQNHRLKTVLSYAAEEDLAATLFSALLPRASEAGVDAVKQRGSPTAL